MGKINADLEITMFKSNALPLYAIVDTNSMPLVAPIGVELDGRS